MSEYSKEQLSEMVGKTFGQGTLDSVMDNGNLVIKNGDKSFTQVRARDVKQMMVRSQITNNQIQLSDEVKTQIREEKMGKKFVDERPTLKEHRAAEDKAHRDATAAKYGIE